MPWCPVCKSEYRNVFTVCTDCGAALVDELETGREDMQAENNSSMQNKSFGGEVLLANIKDPVELTYLTSMFEDEGIVCRIIDGDVGQYLQIIHGSSFLGKAVFVRKDDYDKAVSIFKSYKAEITKKE